MIAITGASGFIGSNMIHYLNAVGISEVVAIDDFEVDSRIGHATRANYSKCKHALSYFKGRNMACGKRHS